ncbi:histone H1-like [Heptranchias perlo]|uniref:histone H1-like n=1 Tax=Heptranchias perlo TaxID=212740 RepID=UPI00355A37DF
MADTVPAKADVPAPPVPTFPLSAAPAPAVPPLATKKKAAYRPQKGGAAVAEQILEAVAATKERQAAKLGAVKKTISAPGYEVEKSGVRPNQSASTLANKGSPVETGAGPSSASLNLNQEEEEEEEVEDGTKGGAKRKRRAKKPAKKRAAAEAKLAANKRAKRSAPKSPRKGRVAKARKTPTRPAAPGALGRKRRAPKRR